MTILSRPSDEDPSDFAGESECPNCGGEGMVWGCFEDCCCRTDCDSELGCSPHVCGWCNGDGDG